MAKWFGSRFVLLDIDEFILPFTLFSCGSNMVMNFPSWLRDAPLVIVFRKQQRVSTLR